MDAIRIKSYFSIITHTKDMVELRRGVWNSQSHMIQDDEKKGILSDIILALNQYNSVADIAKSLNAKRSAVESVIDYLQHLGVLQSSPESFFDYYIDHLMPTLKRFDQTDQPIIKSIILIGDHEMNPKIYRHFQQLFDASLFAMELINATSFWTLLEKSDDEWLFDALEQRRFVSQFEAWRDKFVILSLSQINPLMITRFNRVMHELNITWIHLAIDGPFILVGPTFQGNQGPCYDCFEMRVNMNLREYSNYQKYKNAILAKQVHIKNDPLLDVTSPLLIAHATVEILNYVMTKRTFTLHKILTIFLPTMEFVYHDVLKLPACRTCGSMTYRDDTQLYFDFQRLMNEEI